MLKLVRGLDAWEIRNESGELLAEGELVVAPDACEVQGPVKLSLQFDGVVVKAQVEE